MVHGSQIDTLGSIHAFILHAYIFFLRVVSMHSYCMHARCQSLQPVDPSCPCVSTSQQLAPTANVNHRVQHFNFLSISSSTRPTAPEVRGQYRTHVRGHHSTHVGDSSSTHRIRIARPVALLL
jgi:hypothetical protein